MSNPNIIRAWKDPGYRSTLSPSQRAALPPHPAGAIEISEGDLGNVAGGILMFPPTEICSCMCSLRCPWVDGTAGLQPGL
jgi:mersacidin/lichenicidin family type 2 lantibiotic